MTDLNTLASMVEAATGPDRALMCAAFKAAFPEVSAGAWDAIDTWDAAYDRFCAMLDVGAHESAAMTLVDSNWFCRVGNDGEGADPSLYRADIGHSTPDQIIAFTRVTAATPALALTAASLRARAAMEAQHG